MFWSGDGLGVGRGKKTHSICYALAANVDGSKVLAGEDGRLFESAGVSRLVEPGQLAIESALAAQNLLKGPEVVSVPEQELVVAVHIGRERLVKSNQILVPAPRLTELARGIPGHQAPQGTGKGAAVAVRIRVPLATDARVGTLRSCDQSVFRRIRVVERRHFNDFGLSDGLSSFPASANKRVHESRNLFLWLALQELINRLANAIEDVDERNRLSKFLGVVSVVGQGGRIGEDVHGSGRLRNGS